MTIWRHFREEKSKLWRKEGNILLKDTLNTFYLRLYGNTLYLRLYGNTFYLRLYGVRHMVMDHSYSERGNPLPPHGLLVPISSNGSFICTIPQIGYYTFVTPVVEHWLEREISQWVHHEGSIRRPAASWEDTLPWSYISLLETRRVRQTELYITLAGTRNSSMGSELRCSEGRKEMFYLTTHSAHFIYGYMGSNIW